MTIEEIRKNAPDGATHYELNLMFINTIYIRYIEGYPFYFYKGDWAKCNSYFEATPLY